jgi:two-component SAPR family response regulator
MGKTNEQIGTAWKPLCAFSSSPQGERIPTLKIVTLGQTYVTLDGLEIVWHATSAREPLFYLLSFPEGRSKDNVALALWPDEENENAASSNRFRVALHRLRRALGKTEAVFKEYERYRLSPELLATSDVSAMQSALHDAQIAGPPLAHGVPATHEALQRAVDLSGGEYLPDVRTDWADTARAECKASYVRATLELSMLHCEAAECDLAIRHLAQALRVDPVKANASKLRPTYRSGACRCDRLKHRGKGALVVVQLVAGRGQPGGADVHPSSGRRQLLPLGS